MATTSRIELDSMVSAALHKLGNELDRATIALWNAERVADWFKTTGDPDALTESAGLLADIVDQARRTVDDAGSRRLSRSSRTGRKLWNRPRRHAVGARRRRPQRVQAVSGRTWR